jgi:hypothetical protein
LSLRGEPVAAFFLGGQSMQIDRTAIGKLAHPVLTEAA